MNANDLRLPPHSIEAEQSLIGGILLAGSKAFDQIEGMVSEANFYRDDHCRIYAAAKLLYDAGKPIDAVTVADLLDTRHEGDLTGGLAYLGEIASNTPSASNVRRYAEIIREKAILRGLQAIADQVRHDVASPGSKRPHEIAARAEAEMLRLLDSGGDEPVRLQDAMGEAINEVEERRERGGRCAGMQTGFPALDDITAGFEAGQLVIVAARPSVGKTAFACAIADNASRQNIPTIFFTLEMSHREIALRVLARRAGVSMAAMRTGTGDDAHWRQMCDVLGRSGGTPLFIDDRAAINVSHVRAKARRIARTQGLGLIVIDYLQLMRGTGDSRAQEIGSISRGLKALAKELQVPIVALAQLNRNVETRTDKRPITADLRDSGEIEQDADMVLMLHREELHNQSPEWAGIAEILVRKNRNGPLGDVTMHYDAPLMRFKTYNGPPLRGTGYSISATTKSRGFDD